MYNTYNETKASVVERLIRTLKTRMWRYFTAKKTMRYIDTLPDLVYSYNHSIRSSIEKTPANVTVYNEKHVWHMLYDDHGEVKHVKYKFNIGDQVRISKTQVNFVKYIFTKYILKVYIIKHQSKKYQHVNLVKLFYMLLLN